MAEEIGLRAIIDLSQFNRGLSSYNRGIGQMNKKTTGFTSTAGKQFTGLGKGLLKFGAIAGGAALAGVAALGAGLVAFGASAVKEGAAYTMAMSNVKAITGATAEEFDALSASAEELGRTTKFTAVEAAEGMSFLAMAGFEVNEVISAMPGVLNLAAAGNLELGQSADIVSNVLTGFGAEADQTGRFVDVLTKTFTSSNTNLQQLGQGMKFVAPVAADLGLSVEQTAAAMGVLGDGGIQASMAGTTLRTALLNLAAPVGKGKALLEELGIEIFDAQGKMLPFPKVIGNFNEAMEGMSDAQKTATLRTIIGKRAISGFSLLLNKGEKGLENFGNELLASGGTAAEIAATQLDNLSGDVTLFKSALSGVKIDVFKALEPVLRGVVGQGKFLLETFGPLLANAFNIAINSITAFVSKVQSAFQKFGIRGAAISILGQLGLSPDQIALALGVVDKIGEIVSKISGAFERFGIRGATISILGLLGLEPNQIASVLGIVDSFVEGVTVAFGKVSGAFERFGARGAAISILGLLGLEPETIGIILSTVDTIIVAITGFVSSVASFLGSLSFNEIIGGLAGIGAVVAGGILASLVAGLFALLAPINLIIAAATLLGVAWAGNWGNIQGITMSAIATIQSVLGVLVSTFTGLVLPQIQAVFTNLTMALNNLGIGWGDIWNAIVTATGIVIGIVIVTIGGLVTGISTALAVATGFIGQFGENFKTIIEGIATIFVGFVNLFTALINGEWAAAWDSFVLIFQGAAELFTGIIDLIVTTIQAAFSTILGFFGGFGLGVIDIFTGLSDTLVGNSIIPDMVTAIIETFTAMVQPILSIFSTLSEGIGTVLGAIFGGGGEEAAAPTMAFDPADMLAGIEAVTVKTKALNLAISNISLITLPFLTEAFLITIVVMMEQLLLLLEEGIMPVDLALIMMYTVTLPTLAVVTQTTTQIMVAGFVMVINIVLELVAALITLINVFPVLAEAASTAFDTIRQAIVKLKSPIKSLISLIEEIIDAFNRMGEAAEDALNRAGSSTVRAGQKAGLGFREGIGFQAGTRNNTSGPLGLGFKIPGGFPNDSFGPFFAQSGEEMLITPRGTTIEGLVFARLANLLSGSSVQGSSVTNNITNNTTNNLSVQTSSTSQGVVRQFDVMRGFVGT